MRRRAVLLRSAPLRAGALAAALLPVFALARAAPALAQPQRVPTPAEAAGAADDDGTPRERVYIVSVPTDASLEAVSARVGAAARAALRRVPHVDWQGPDQRFLGYDDDVLVRLTRARTRLEQGREAYTNLQVGDAIILLAGAVEDFDRAASALEDPTDLGQALLLLGASYALEGRDREATRVFRRLHVQMPGVAPDPNEFNPTIVQRFQQAAVPERERTSGAISVVSDPPGAIAYVDFVPRGPTPTEVTGLSSGEHVVRVTRAGATPFVQPVELRRGARGAVNAFVVDNEGTAGLHEALVAIAEANVERMERGGAIAQVAGALELDKIGVIRVSPATVAGNVQLELLVFETRTGRRLLRGGGEVSVERGALERGVERLVAGGMEAAFRAPAPIERRPVVEAPPPPPPPSQSERGGSVAGKWWFWAAIGGAVVVTGVVVAVAASSGGPDLGTRQGGQVVLEF
jgi:hypothetical protein